VFESAKNGAMKIIPTKLTQNVRMKQVGDAVTQNDPVARESGQSTIKRGVTRGREAKHA